VQVLWKGFYRVKVTPDVLQCALPTEGMAGRRKALSIKGGSFCKRCNKEFETHDKRKVFCSTGCKIKFYNEARPTTKELQKECPQCHKMFVPMQKKGVGKTYCSNKCQHRFNYIKNHQSIKERYASWQKKNKWDGNWEEALNRDKYTCQICGLTLYPSQWEGKRILMVHHWDGSGEKEAKNHGVDNLVTLCGSCHREFHTQINLVRIDGKYHVRGKIFSILNLKQVDTIGG
jgi:5-methylcytosine-specific restriction endonuclease McrA